MTGILEYKVENRGEKLWVSQSSDSLKHKDWVGEKFPAQSRPCTVMLERQGGNVLTRQSLEDVSWLEMFISLSNNTGEKCRK